jgi:hypothetical protein
VARPVNPIDQYLRDLDQTRDLAPILRRLFHECQAQEQRDRALMVAQALAALGQAGPLEQQHVARFRSARLLRIDRPLAATELEQLLDLPPGDRALGPLIEALLPAVIRLTSRPRKDFGLGPPSPQASALLFSRILDYLQSRLGAGEVEVHPMPGRPQGLAMASVMEKDGWRPVLVVGADLLTGRSEPELAFVIARELVLLMRPMLLRSLVPDLATQALLILAAIGLSRPDPVAEARQPGLREQLRHLSANLTLDDFERVGDAVRGLDAVGEPFDLPRWNAAVDRFALRVALLLSGDLEVAASGICPPGSSASCAPLRDLIRFAVSPTHLALRQSLGLAIRD